MNTKYKNEIPSIMVGFFFVIMREEDLKDQVNGNQMIQNITPYEYKGFLIRDNDYGKALILDSKNVGRSANFVKKERIEGLEINYSLGYTDSGLECLSMFDTVKHIRIVNHKINIEGLYYLKELETLELGDESNQEVDFTQFPSLRQCFFSWRRRSESVFQCSRLEKLGIEGYPYESLDSISNLTKLVYLGIGNARNLITLKGIEKFINLNEMSLSSLPKMTGLGLELNSAIEKIELFDMKELTDLGNLSRLTRLKTLSIERCKKVFTIEALTNIRELEVLHLDNCGEIESLKPIDGLNRLKVLHFIESTNIVDGDLTVLRNKNIKSLYFQDRRHYTDKRKELQLSS